MDDVQPGSEPREAAEDTRLAGKKRGKRTVVITVAVVAGVLVLAAAGSLIWLTRGLSTYRNMTISDVDVARATDGVYRGGFEGGRWSNTLEVTVKDRRITGIEIIKDIRFKSRKVPEEVFSRVVEKQTPAVDAVSGATVTSKAYMKSIENALLEASR